MPSHTLIEISIAVILATLLAWLCKLLKQPTLIAYILAGVIAGETSGFGWVDTQELESVSELGLILLLFMIGLEMDLKRMEELGKSIIVPAALQFPISVALGVVVLPFLLPGFADQPYATLYLAVAAALSSTLIGVKLLYDKFELTSLPGRITIGILIFQDVWAIAFIALQGSFQDPSLLPVLLALAKGAGLCVLAWAVRKYVLPPFLESMAKVPELLMIATLAWCFGMAILAKHLDLSFEIGALIAGVSISAFPYTFDVASKINSLRDFFIILFFVSLGANAPAPSPEIIVPAIVLSLFVIVSRLLVLTPLLNLFKHDRRLSFIPSLNLSQMSEFSLVICALGVSMRHIDQELLSVIVYAFLITAIVSPYFIFNNHALYTLLEPLLARLGIASPGSSPSEETLVTPRKIIFLGFSRYASSLFHDLTAAIPEFEEDIGVVDFNPEVKRKLDARGVRCFYGDITNSDTLLAAQVDKAKILVCSLPNHVLKGSTNEKLLELLRHVAPQAYIIVTASSFRSAHRLFNQGAAYVFIPRMMTLSRVSEVILAMLRDAHEGYRSVALDEIRERERGEVLP